MDFMGENLGTVNASPFSTDISSHHKGRTCFCTITHLGRCIYLNKCIYTYTWICGISTSSPEQKWHLSLCKCVATWFPKHTWGSNRQKEWDKRNALKKVRKTNVDRFKYGYTEQWSGNSLRLQHTQSLPKCFQKSVMVRPGAEDQVSCQAVIWPWYRQYDIDFQSTTSRNLSSQKHFQQLQPVWPLHWRECFNVVQGELKLLWPFSREMRIELCTGPWWPNTCETQGETNWTQSKCHQTTVYRCGTHAHTVSLHWCRHTLWSVLWKVQWCSLNQRSL